MKVLLLLGVYWLSIVLAHPINDFVEDQWEMIPTEDGHFHLVNINSYDNQPEELTDFPVKFLLFTQANPAEGQEIISGESNSLDNSKFNAKHPTRFLIHGWKSNPNSMSVVEIRDAYLKRGSFNVIAVDWSAAAAKNYVAAKRSIDSAGEKVARFMDFLNSRGIASNNIYLIGHSLGAHLSGMAGKKSKSKPDTIYGLDPAGPLFTFNDPAKRLAIGDANYVQIIHTNTELYGFKKPIGTSSFYPAWGRLQPGCAHRFCSHARAYEYFAESLQADNKPFLGRQCSWHDIKRKQVIAAEVRTRVS